jgi:hypothetical protein
MKPEEHPALSSRALRAISLTCLLGSLSLFWSGKYSPALSLLGGSFLAAALSHDPRSLWELLRRDALDAIGATHSMRSARRPPCRSGFQLVITARLQPSCLRSLSSRLRET